MLKVMYLKGCCHMTPFNSSGAPSILANTPVLWDKEIYSSHICIYIYTYIDLLESLIVLSHPKNQ